MTTRRNFLKGATATGIAFCSCGMLDAARAQPRVPRLPVKVNGKRVLTVDVHSHCYFHEAINLMGDRADKVLPPVKGVPEHFIVIEQRLKEMDAMAIGHGGAVDQSVLVRQGARYCCGDRQGTKREIGRTVRIAAGTVRGFRLADPAVSGPRGATT